MNRLKETPFELLQRENRQRRLALQTSAGKYSLNRSSITPEAKGTVYQSITEEDPFCKASCSRTAVNSCLKKSFFNRKWMNKSIDSRLTSEEFRRLKLRFDKVEKPGETENSPSKFRQVWESQCKRKYSAELDENVKHEKEQMYQQSCFKDKLQKEELEKIKILNKRMGIDEIAEKRRATLNFDLEILGNKKSIKNIRIKEMIDNRKTTAEHQDEKNHKEVSISPQKLSPVKERRQCCMKSKKMDFVFSQTCQTHQNLPRKIFSPNFMDFTEGKGDHFAEEKYQQYYTPALPQSICNKLRHSWNPGNSPTMESKANKSPQNLRKKMKTGALCNIVNDIQGWSVFPEVIGNFSDQMLTL